LIPIKVIIADDEPGILLLLHSILHKLEGVYIVGTAANARDTLKLVEEHKPDLVFLDILLPDMKGINLAEKLKEINKDLFIVFILLIKSFHWKPLGFMLMIIF